MQVTKANKKDDPVLLSLDTCYSNETIDLHTMRNLICPLLKTNCVAKKCMSFVEARAIESHTHKDKFFYHKPECVSPMVVGLEEISVQNNY